MMLPFRCYHLCPTVSCPRLDPPSNGGCDPCVAAAGEQASFTCDDQYTLIGLSNITCLTTGRWSEPTPECKS